METVIRKYRVKAFGITKEILNSREKIVEVRGQTVADLRVELLKNYPALAALRSLMIAVNNVYADDTTSLQEGDEIALIPPVSGG
jgi:molybdopterin converting factor subunit 1